jgi:signal transduction histidine kinase
VLLVDDKAENRELVRAYLEPRYHVVEADNGRSALEQVARGEPDLVLLDVMMPGMNGLQACREIKRNAERTFLPVVLLTALDDQEDRNAGLAAGADDFLSKPVDRRELLLRVRGLLRQREQEQLIRRQFEELSHVNALKDDLVSLIVHDMRNPLTSLLGYLELVGRKAVDPKLCEYVEAALLSCGRLREAVDDLLEVRLLEEGRSDSQLETVALTGVVEDALTTIEGARRASDVTIGLHGDDALHAPADRRLLRRSVENLVSNAIKYSARGGVVDVTVRAEGGGVEIVVADRGPGVPDDLKAHVFEKFGTVEARRGQARRGYGLGLYMVRTVAELHKGHVSVHDREDGGSEFKLFLPDASV